MRKVLLLCAAVGVLFAGSIWLGVAAATTAAPALYDARSPQPVATGVDGFRVEADGGVRGVVPGAPADEADASGGTPVPPKLPVSPKAPVATKSPGPSPTLPPSSDAPGATDVPADPADPTRGEQATWLAFQQVVRQCMADAGQDYRLWKWWKAEPRDPSSTTPARPAELTAEEVAAWELALHGTGGRGDDVPWEDAGCWGAAVHTTGSAR